MAFLTGWTYRKQITIAGQSGAGTNYQVKLLVGESSGATGENFDVENKSASFPTGKNVSGDLRFTASDGTTLLPFWVEKVEGTTPNRLATIWVKVSADLGTNQNIYCYYGGATTNVSSGSDTFLLFEDAEDGTTGNDPAGWTLTTSGTGSVKINEEQKYEGSKSIKTYGTISDATQFKKDLSNATATIALTVAIRTDNTGVSNNKFSVWTVGGTIASSGNVMTAISKIYSGQIQYRQSGGSYTNWYTVNSNKWYKYDFYLGASHWSVSDDDGHSASSLTYGTTKEDIGHIWLSGTGSAQGSTGSVWYDYIIARKWITTEPSYSTAGSEETGTATSNPFLSFNF